MKKAYLALLTIVLTSVSLSAVVQASEGNPQPTSSKRWSSFQGAYAPDGFTLVNFDNQIQTNAVDTQCSQLNSDADCGKVEVIYSAGEYSMPAMEKLLAQH